MSSRLDRVSASFDASLHSFRYEKTDSRRGAPPETAYASTIRFYQGFEFEIFMYTKGKNGVGNGHKGTRKAEVSS